MLSVRDVISLIIIILIGCSNTFTANIYSPSLAAVSHFFDVSINTSQASIAFYMFGVTFSQLLYGPISEGFGRKRVLLFGLFIMILGTIICIFANTMTMLIAARAVQGCGSGACASLWRTIVRDRFKGGDLAQVMSYMLILGMCIVMISPLVGGFLQEYFGWRASFIFVLCYLSCLVVGLILCYQESHKSYTISNIRVMFFIKNYSKLLFSMSFIAPAAAISLNYGVLFGWNVIGPVIMIKTFELSPAEYGMMHSAFNVIAVICGGYINGKFVKKMGVSRMIKIGWSIVFTAGVLMLLSVLSSQNSIYIIWLAVMMQAFGLMLLIPNLYSIATDQFSDIIGYCGSLFGFFMMCGAALISAFIAYFPDTALIYSLFIIVSSVISFGLYELGASFSKNQV